MTSRVPLFRVRTGADVLSHIAGVMDLSDSHKIAA
jgi:hypothetical protein